MDDAGPELSAGDGAAPLKFAGGGADVRYVASRFEIVFKDGAEEREVLPRRWPKLLNFGDAPSPPVSDYDIRAWTVPHTFQMRDWGGWFAALFLWGLPIAGAVFGVARPWDRPVGFIPVVLLATLGVQALVWLRLGGWVTIDPIRREISWRRPRQGFHEAAVWSLDEIDAVELRGIASTGILVEVGRRRLQIPVGPRGARPLAASLMATGPVDRSAEPDVGFLAGKPETPKTRPHADLLPARPLRVPGPHWWIAAAVVGGLLGLYADHRLHGLGRWSLVGGPAAALFCFTVGPELRPLEERQWSGSVQAAITVFLRPRRLLWTGAVAFLGPGLPGLRSPTVDYGPGGTGLILIIAAMAFVVVALPDRKAWRTSPVAIAAGAGPRYLPVGARVLVSLGVLLAGLSVAWSAGAFGGTHHTIHTGLVWNLSLLTLGLGWFASIGRRSETLFRAALDSPSRPGP